MKYTAPSSCLEIELKARFYIGDRITNKKLKVILQTLYDKYQI